MSNETETRPAQIRPALRAEEQPFSVPSTTALARYLKRAATEGASQGQPAEGWNHSRWLQTLAKAQGHRNHQAALAASKASAATSAVPTTEPKPRPGLVVQPAPNTPSTYVAARQSEKPKSAHGMADDWLAQLAPGLSAEARLRVLRALSYFDANGRLLRWPAKRGLADTVVWALWMRFDDARRYNEGEVTRMLASLNAFNDPVTLRRELINAKLLGREKDGSVYWKLPRNDAPKEAAALMAALASRLR